jgi:LAS superfamily LD-carboxypeptidase LdcB
MGIAFLVFAILAMKMGVTMVTSGGNPGALSAAKKSFTNAFIGLIIILSAWLIVDTFMRGLLGDNGDIKISNYGPWTDVKCATQTEVDEQTGFFSVEDYDPGDPNDQTEYSGQPTAPAPGSTDRCSPIPDSQLVTFPAAATSGDPERAIADTVNRFLAMRAAAAKSNIDLKVSDGYRAPSDQLSAWNGNGCKLVNKKASCAVRTAAVPCSLGGKGSNHTLGTAVDIKLNSGVYSWLRANASKYGFYNHLSNDLPHWSSTGG